MESRLREKVSENLDLMAQLAHSMQNQARDLSSSGAVVEFHSVSGEGTETRRSKAPGSASSQSTRARPHRASPQEWAELEQVRSQLFALETESRRLLRRADVELANEVGFPYLDGHYY